MIYIRLSLKAFSHHIFREFEAKRKK